MVVEKVHLGRQTSGMHSVALTAEDSRPLRKRSGCAAVPCMASCSTWKGFPSTVIFRGRLYAALPSPSHPWKPTGAPGLSPSTQPAPAGAVIASWQGANVR